MVVAMERIRTMPELMVVRLQPAPDTFGSILKGLRDERGWSQATAAAAFGMDQSLYSKWERDQGGKVDLEILRLAETAFGVEPYSIVKRIEALDQERKAHPFAYVAAQELPARTLVIADKPGVREVLDALDHIEEAQWPVVAKQLRLMRNRFGVEVLPQMEEEPEETRHQEPGTA